MARKNRRARRAEAAASVDPRAASPTPTSSRSWVRFGLFVVVIGAAFAWLSSRAPPAGQVWNAAHGHYHAASGAELPPAGEPGQVWSAEHGHWHDPE